MSRKNGFKVWMKIALLSFVILGVSVYLEMDILSELKNVSLNKTQKEVEEISKGEALRLEKEIEVVQRTVEGLAQHIGLLTENNKLDRQSVIMLLKNSLEKNKNIIAHGSGWEVNSFDQDDSSYAGLKSLGSDKNGRFLPYAYRGDDGQIGVDVLVEYDVEGAGDWYLVPKRTKKPILTEPYIYPVNGVDVLMTTISYPVLDSKENFLGVVTADIGLDYLSNRIEEIESIKNLKGSSTIVSKEGTVICSNVNENPTFQSLMDEGIINDEIMDNLSKYNKGSFFTELAGEKEEDLVVYQPINFNDMDTVWGYITNIPKAQILKEYNSIYRTDIISIAIIIIISIILIILITRGINNPIKEMILLMHKAEQGDLTNVWKKERGDEFGVLFKSYNNMVVNIKSLINSAKESGIVANEETKALSEISVQSDRAANEIAEAMDQMANSISDQAKDAEEIAQKTTELGNGIERIGRLIEGTFDIAQESNKIGDNGIEIIKKLSTKTLDIANSIKVVDTTIDDVNEYAHNAESITQLIDDIAEQTNLLALNASIEAARAGEAGKGFAVVADEIRKLAVEVSQATNDIRERIHNIQDSSKNAVMATETVKEMQEEQEKWLNDTNEIFNHISNSLSDLVGNMENVTKYAHEIEEGKDTIVEAINNISAITEENSAGTQEVSASVEEQLATMESLNRHAENTKKSFEKLLEDIKRFKVD
ncbi:methyl-accepting chemotaxis protein [Clostridiisalibacter paucivorans]|uniref:methyl-accepting chemotaxis protein n=1 Tax=Clostridiisalibacter paucivorans TaxID=408753 RepID=UPI00047A8DB3|nr:methyl-accepting chemotaxis protein [Clostridiisalibacter paucivorans]